LKQLQTVNNRNQFLNCNQFLTSSTLDNVFYAIRHTH